MGNGLEYISEKTQSKILGAIHSSWEKYAHEEYPNAGSHLFGDDFQSTITGKVDKEGALAKAPYRGRQVMLNLFLRGGTNASPVGFFEEVLLCHTGLPNNRHYQRGANNYQTRPAPQRARFHKTSPAILSQTKPQMPVTTPLIPVDFQYLGLDMQLPTLIQWVYAFPCMFRIGKESPATCGCSAPFRATSWSSQAPLLLS